MAITFDGVTLQKPSPYAADYSPTTNETILLSGKHNIQSSTEHGYKVSFICLTTTEADITNLIAKIGTEGSLVDDNGTHTKCYITAFTSTEILPDTWQYQVSFAQKTV